MGQQYIACKDTLSVDDFTMEYYGVDDVAGVEGVTRQWAPIEGGKVNLLTYLQMGAGEQQIRITYKAMPSIVHQHQQRLV